MESGTCRLVELPKIFDPRGNLTFIEGNRHVPFAMRRAFWIYDVPGGEMRGGHAYRKNRELIVAVSGSFEVEVDDGKSVSRYLLNRSYFGLYMPPLHWRSLVNFSTNSLCLVLASEDYDETDYLRDYMTFKQLRST
ncbi:FdtA/QdtA family cupin domain-containing protein [Geobacter sp.]|uniref:sugar 3,4-ketoisomerase n=1 Tax=Geobacter sp. TaxID=46610 RepID=UPI0026089B00|nr:FdtA/QdtA family cupin domain-containing protein [Geobacter sp.]